MAVSLRADGVVLPSPTELTAADEIVWSANTGRSLTGLMIGDVVAQKRTLTLRWGVLTAAEFELLRAHIRSGFHPFTLTVDGDAVTFSAYRGTLSGALLGAFGGVTYYREASVSVVEQ